MESPISINIHVESLRTFSEGQRTRHALVSPYGPEHNNIVTELQLCMANDLTRFLSCEHFNESERYTKPLNRPVSVIVTEDWEDRLHVQFPGS
jgi:hypothetical protein